MPDYCARYIKNLVYAIDDTSAATGTQGGQAGVGKPLESTTLYIENLVLPAGYNQTIGAPSFKQTKEVFVFVYNDQGNHTIYRLNGVDKTYNIVKHGAVLRSMELLVINISPIKTAYQIAII